MGKKKSLAKVSYTYMLYIHIFKETERETEREASICMSYIYKDSATCIVRACMKLIITIYR